MRLLKLRTATLLAACITLNTSCMMAVRTVARAHQPDPTRIFDTADTNGDGIITREEFQAARERLFSRLDRNGDGYVDQSDMSGRLAGRQKAQEKLAEMITLFDKDGDGRISKAEFVGGATPLFDLADTNHDGQLSQEEVAAAKHKMAERRRS